VEIYERVKIHEYAPHIFKLIRTMDGINPIEIRESLHPSANRDSVFKAGESQGKSGSFFFFSKDRKFIIKTMNDGEMSIFMESLVDYYSHLKTHRNSLMARIYGIFTVKMEDIVPVNLLLMANTI